MTTIPTPSMYLVWRDTIRTKQTAKVVKMCSYLKEYSSFLIPADET